MRRATMIECGKYLIALCVILDLRVAMVSTITVPDFFPVIKKNLTRVTWAHAVNDLKYLDDTLKNDYIMMIEADISMGTTPDSKEIIPIMAHPPANESDLSLAKFLETISKHNADNTVNKKGAKLDFKSAEALTAAVATVKTYTEQNKFPIWINADILPGPINSAVTPVDPSIFFEKSASISNVAYSIGWTTYYGSTMQGTYKQSQIDDMITTLKQNKVTNEITFPVRAGLAAESLAQMKTLLEKTPGSTLTIWSSEGDNVVVADLNILINDVGVEKVYIDVPEDLMKQIRIKPSKNNSMSVISSRGLMMAGVLLALVTFVNLF